MGATFKPVVKTRRKDGSRTVYVRVTFKRQSRHIPTTLVCTAGDLTRSGRIKSSSVLEKADGLMRRMRDALRDVSFFQLETWDVDRVVSVIRDAIRGEEFRLDFFAWADGWLDCKTPTTRRTYDQALGALERYLGRRQLDVNEITRAMLLGFVDFLNGEPKMHVNLKTQERTPGSVPKVRDGAASRYLQKLGRVFREARLRYNDEDRGLILIPRSPFDAVRVKVPPTSGGQRSVGREVMQRAILAEVSDPRERVALDAFVVSFCLMGANLADLREAAPPVGVVWEYHRRKTRERRADGAYMRVTVPRCAGPFIARLRESSARYGRFWLPALQLGGTGVTCAAMLNAALRRWQRREGLPDFTFYAARHTWATLARRSGVEKATVDECLGHVGDFHLTDIYAERPWDLLDAANAKVLGLFEWPV